MSRSVDHGRHRLSTLRRGRHRLPTVRRGRHQLPTTHLFRRASLILLIVAALAGVQTSAWAYWTADGGGAGHASVGTLNAPTNFHAAATLGSSTVDLTWVGSTLSTGTAAQGYYLTRVSANGTTAACGTSAANLTTVLLCADRKVPDGTFHYVVTAVYESWTAPSAPSNAVTVTATTKITVSSGSGQSATVGQAFASPLVALVTDANDNPVPGVTVTFTASATGASGTFANTPTAVTDANGLAAPSVFTANTTAGTYNVTAAAGSGSADFTLTNNAGVATKLAFSQQPSDTIVGLSISPSPTVQSLDAFGNLTSSTTSVTMAIGTGPSAGTLSGTTTATAVDGVAAFPGLSINHVGTYTLTATGAGLSTPSSTFTVTLAPVNLGAVGDFAILSTAGVTDIPTSAITGNVGTSPITGAAITGLTCPEVTGKIYSVDAAGPLPCAVTDAPGLTAAVSSMETAYTNAAGRTLPDFVELGDGGIGGLTLSPGLYKWSTGVLISNDITLSGGPNDVWIFQIAKTLDEASAQRVIMSGGAQAKNVFWQVAGAVTIGTTAHFEGTVLAMTNIAMNTGASINGRLLAQTAVTLQQNRVAKPQP